MLLYSMYCCFSCLLLYILETGAGFSGFYYHLGFLHGSLHTSNKDEINHHALSKEYYCYSSGCLGLVMAPYSVHDIWDAAVNVQHEWWNGKLSRYNIVENFVHGLMVKAKPRPDLYAPQNVRILVTDRQNGVRVRQASNQTDLVQLLIDTTAIPMITSPWPSDMNQLAIDGGFSRWLHPRCAETVHVPYNFATTVHTFNMALDKATAFALYHQGLNDASAVLLNRRVQTSSNNDNDTRKEAIRSLERSEQYHAMSSATVS